MPLRGSRCEATRLALGQRGVAPRPSALPGAPKITTISNQLVFRRATGSLQSHFPVP